MKEEAIAVNLEGIVDRLNQEVKALKGIDFTDNWKGQASTALKADYDEAVRAINVLKSSIMSLATSLRRTAACKTVDPKIKSAEKQIAQLEATPVIDENEKMHSQELKQLRLYLDQYRNTKNSNLKSAQQYLNDVKSIQITVPQVVTVETNYNYTDLKDLISGAFKGYSLAYNHNAWAKNSVPSDAAVVTTTSYLAARETVKNTATTTTSTGSGPRRSPSKNSATSVSTDSSDVNTTFKTSWMDQSTYTIPSQYLEDPQFLQMVEAANDCKDVKYVFGANEDPTTGTMDCSSFVSYLCNKSGHEVGRINSTNFRSNAYTTHVDASDAVPGDIVTFNGHVGVYIGDGMMIHCNQGKKSNGVNIMKVSTFAGTGLEYRRMK